MIKKIGLLKHYSRLFCRKSFYKAHFFIYKISLRGMGVLNFEKNINGEYFFVKKFFKSSKCPTIFDIGANIGQYAEKVKEINPTSKIYSFEPHPVTYNRLQMSAQQYNYNTFQIALGEKNGTILFYDYKDNTGSEHASVYKEVIEEIHGKISSQIFVPMMTLDLFCGEHAIENIDLLKIDVEGNELRVLEGAQNLINQNKISVIVFEFNEMNLISRVFLRDFFNILPNYNFFRLLPDGLVAIEYNPLQEIFAYQNIVALRKK